MWKIGKITDEAYFAVGEIFKGMESPLDRNNDLVVSASFLKNNFDTNPYHHLITGGYKVDEDKQVFFTVGSAFHCYVLEHEEFFSRYHVSDFPDPTRETIRIGTNDFYFIEEAAKNIQIKYPDVCNGQNVEYALFGVLDDVPVKCKIDKLNIKKSGKVYQHVEILDLKGVYFDPFKLAKSPNGDRWKLRKMLSDNNYDLQAYFYTRLVEEWLLSIGQHCEVSFSLLVASKETYQCQKFRVGQGMMETGKQKFDSVWKDVRDFVLYGKTTLIDEEVL